jgi:hypothetical protein
MRQCAGSKHLNRQGDEAVVQRLWDHLAEEAELEREIAAADASGDFSTSATLEDRARDVITESNGIGKGYGFRECPDAGRLFIRRFLTAGMVWTYSWSACFRPPW